MSSKFIDSKELMSRLGFSRFSERYFRPKFEALGVKPIRIGKKNVWIEEEINKVIDKVKNREVFI